MQQGHDAVCGEVIRRGSGHPPEQRVSLCALSLLCRTDRMLGTRRSRLVLIMVAQCAAPRLTLHIPAACREFHGGCAEELCKLPAISGENGQTSHRTV